MYDDDVWYELPYVKTNTIDMKEDIIAFDKDNQTTCSQYTISCVTAMDCALYGHGTNFLKVWTLKDILIIESNIIA